MSHATVSALKANLMTAITLDLMTVEQNLCVAAEA